MIGLRRRFARGVLLTLLAGLVLPQPAMATSAEVTRGISWLSGQIQGDGSLAGEAVSLAAPLQSRTEAAVTLSLADAAPQALHQGLKSAAAPEEPTEFLARRLLALRTSGAADASSLLPALLGRQNGDGGFGAMPALPSDPLDAAWAAWALSAYDPSLPALGGVRSYLIQALLADGGVDGGSAAERIQASALALSALKLQPRTVATSDAIARLTGWLLRQQASDGSWLQDAYLTALSLTAVGGETADGTVLDGGRRYLVNSQGADGSWAQDPFLTAWAIRALLPQRTTPFDPGPAALAGRLIDSVGGGPVIGAAVALQGPLPVETASDAEGRFAFSDLPAGDYTLSISRAGYQSLSRTYPFASGQTLMLGDMALSPEAGTGMLRGLVTAASGAPLAGVTITVSGSASRETLTDSSGGFEIVDLPPGEITVTASLGEYLPVSGSGTLSAGQILLFSPVLYTFSEPPPPSAGHWRGSVVAAGTNLPLAGVSLEVNGTVLGSTAADGGFDLQLAAGTYSFRLVLNGYDPVSGSFILAAGGVADSGRLILSAQRTESTLSGKVLDNKTATPVAGALVEVVGKSYATTDAAGAYRIQGLTGDRFDVRISATGYLTQLWQVAVDRPRDIVQDFRLGVDKTGQVQLDALQVSPNSLGRQTPISISTTARSFDTESLSLAPSLQVLNSAGTVVGTAQAHDAGGELLGAFTLAPTEARALVFEWNSGQFPPGDYRVVARLSEAGTATAQNGLGQVLTEQAGTVRIVPAAAFGGSLSADPPVLHAVAGATVHLSALVRNEGNIDLPAQTYRLEAVQNQTGTRRVLQDLAAAPLAVGQLATLAFADWAPAEPGDYRLELTALNQPEQGVIATTVYVGEAATGIFTLDRTVVPKGTQTVRGMIDVTGTDAVTGSVSDPLVPLIRQAVQKALDYNDPVAANWTLSNKCLGCHVATQALVGGELNRDRASFNAQNRNTLLNAIATYQQSNGALYASHPEYSRTQTTLGAWALNAWHKKDDVALTLVRAADYLMDQQESSGSWSADHASGWWNDRPANTAVNLKTLIDAQGLLSTAAGGNLKSYARTAWISGQGMNGAYYLASDAENNVYVSNYAAGTVLRVKPDGTVEPWLSGIANPLGVAVAPDGTTYVASPGALYRRNPDGSKTAVATQRGDGLTVGPDGNLYMSDYSANRIVQVTPAGQVSDYLVGGLLRGPEGLAFTPGGELVVANYNDGKILKIKPDKTVETVVTWTNGNPRGVVRYGDGWLVGTTTGLYRYNADWQGERLTFAASDGLTVTPDGRIVTGDGGASIFRNTPTAINVATKLTSLASAIDKATNWLLSDANVNTNSNLDVAFRLMGLGAARDYYQGGAVAAALQTKMEAADALLRSRQRTDGGWGRLNGWGSDSMVTAMVGLALDELDPSPTDPVIRNAIQWLLSTQAANGSWYSQNGIFSTRLAATTWVAIWLPTALDRIGGIDTQLTLALPGGITLANPTVAPKTATPNAFGGSSYTWDLQGVTRTGRTLDFDLTFQNLALNETRPAAREAYLTFNNSFTGQPLNAPVAIPDVTAGAFLATEVATDRASYGGNSDVSIRADVANLSQTPVDGTVSVRFDIETASGEPVTSLPPVGPATVQPGQTVELPAIWNTGTYLAGDYAVVATFLNAEGEVIGQKRVVFTIEASCGDVNAHEACGSTAAEATLALDKTGYAPNDAVRITGRVFNPSNNRILENLSLEERVFSPDGTELYRASQAIAQLVDGMYAERLFSVPLAGAVPGVYRVEQTVTDGLGRVLDRKVGEFRVQSSALTGFGLLGTLEASPKTVSAGAEVRLSHTLSNRGNAPMTNVPAILRVLDPAAGAVLGEWTRAVDVPQGGVYSAIQPFTAPSVAADTNLVAVLYAVMDGKERVLAQDTFLVSGTVRLEVDANQGGPGRVLVLADCGGNDACPEAQDLNSTPADCDRTANDPAYAVLCAAERRRQIHRVLNELGVKYRLVTDEAAFRREFRSGGYDTYWLSGGRVKLLDVLAEEIREAVYRGDGLIVDGQHDERNLILDEVSGIRFRGRFAALDPAARFTAAPFDLQTLGVLGRALRLDILGGEVSATLPSGSPALVRRGYGRGRSVLFAFDLAATFSAEGSHNAWRDVLDKALADVKPVPLTAFTADAQAHLRLDVHNPATLSGSGEFTLTLPQGATLTDAPPALTPGSGNTWLWDFDLAAGGDAHLDLMLRLPDADGVHTLTATLRERFGSAWTPAGNYSWEFVVEGAESTIGKLRVALAAYSSPTPKEAERQRLALSALDAAVAQAQAGQWNEAIRQGVASGEALTQLGSPDVPLWRRHLARLLQEYAARDFQAEMPIP